MIGKTIASLLTNNSGVTALVPSANIFPYVMNEDTELPAIVYKIDSVSPEYNKGGWALDSTDFSVFCFSKDYSQLQDIVKAVRAALELSQTGYSTESIGRIYMRGIEEGFDFTAESFFNVSRFSVNVNNY